MEITQTYEYEYQIYFNLCSKRFMNSYTLNGFPESQHHYGINNGSDLKQCCEGQKYEFIYKCNIAPTLVYSFVDSIVKNHISKTICNSEKTLDENETLRGYYRCYKGIKILLLPPAYGTRNDLPFYDDEYNE